MQKFFLFTIMFLSSLLLKADETENYIKKYRKIAVKEMGKHGIPASITLAQGILESGNGKSRLAKKARNHFGIKCTSDWNGRTMKEDDDKKDECFRKYRKAEQSYADHSEFLVKRDRYKFLFDYDKRDYKSWAEGLKKAGYATNPAYPQLLISLIERYDLHQYDQKHAKRKIKQEDKLEKKNKKEFKEKKSPVLAEKTHIVQKGDTLYSISKKYNVEIDTLRKLNGKSGNDLFLGEKLKVK